MKSTNIVKTLLMVFVSVFYLVTWGGLSEAWARGPGGKHGTTSSITQPGNTQGSPSTLSGTQGQSKMIDKASPRLFKSNAAGKHYDEVKINLR